MDKRLGKVAWGPNGTRQRTTDRYWRQPLKWNREAEQSGERPRVFCASLADVFEDWDGPIVDSKDEQLFWPHNALENPRYIPESHCGGGEPSVTMNDLRSDLFQLIDQTPHLDWLLLTKRIENARRMWPIPQNGRDPAARDYLVRDNVWLIQSVSTQEDVEKHVPELLKLSDLVPVLGLSIEPLLGPIEFSNVTKRSDCVSQLGKRALEGIDWVIVGGESGPQARPCNAEWIESIVEQCKEAGVPCFVKQLGSNSTFYQPVLSAISAVETPARQYFQDKKGGDPAEWPTRLRVRELPIGASEP